MVDENIRKLAGDWERLHDGAWELDAPFTPELQRAARTNLSRTLRAYLPDAVTATVLSAADGPVAAAITDGAVFLVNPIEVNEETLETIVETRQIPLPRDRARLTVRSFHRKDDRGVARIATWTLEVDGDEVLVFDTQVSPGDEAEEVFPRLLASQLGWDLPAEQGIRLAA